MSIKKHLRDCYYCKGTSSNEYHGLPFYITSKYEVERHKEWFDEEGNLHTEYVETIHPDGSRSKKGSCL